MQLHFAIQAKVKAVGFRGLIVNASNVDRFIANEPFIASATFHSLRHTNTRNYLQLFTKVYR